MKAQVIEHIRESAKIAREANKHIESIIMMNLPILADKDVGDVVKRGDESAVIISRSGAYVPELDDVVITYEIRKVCAGGKLHATINKFASHPDHDGGRKGWE